jgi:hypothetical protein
LIAKMDDHDIWMAFFTDPDGHMLAIMHEAPKGYAPQRQDEQRRTPSSASPLLLIAQPTSAAAS